MSDLYILHFLWLAGTVFLAYLLPKNFQLDAIALSTATFLFRQSFWSGVYLCMGSLVVYVVIRSTRKSQLLFIAGLGSVLFFVTVVYQDLFKTTTNPEGLPILLGLSYYTCRHIHVLVEGYKNNLPRFSIRQYFHYHFFLPVLIAGPIHRFEHFQRQAERRRWNTDHFTSGLERIVYGYVKVVVMGNYLIHTKLHPIFKGAGDDDFTGLLLQSAINWLYLYIEFSGFTDIALGFSLILGFRLEENFNFPLMARNLTDFWQRWHITLSQWCRDYIYMPVLAFTRNPWLGVFTAMLAMGLWHETSVYYVLWGLYHAVGLVLSRWLAVNDPMGMRALPSWLQSSLSRIATFGWLIAGMPIITLVLRIP